MCLENITRDRSSRCLAWMWPWHLISQNEHMKLWKNKCVYKFVIHSLNAFEIVMKEIDKMSFALRRRGRKVRWDHPGACLCLPLVELPCQQYSRCVTYRLWAGKVKSRGQWGEQVKEVACRVSVSALVTEPARFELSTSIDWKTWDNEGCFLIKKCNRAVDSGPSRRGIASELLSSCLSVQAVFLASERQEGTPGCGGFTCHQSFPAQIWSRLAEIQSPCPIGVVKRSL